MSFLLAHLKPRFLGCFFCSTARVGAKRVHLMAVKPKIGHVFWVFFFSKVHILWHKMVVQVWERKTLFP